MPSVSWPFSYLIGRSLGSPLLYGSGQDSYPHEIYCGRMASETPNNISRIRKEQGISQDEVAARIGGDVTGATISRIESGRMALTLDWMVRIAAALQVPVQDLIVEGGG